MCGRRRGAVEYRHIADVHIVLTVPDVASSCLFVVRVVSVFSSGQAAAPALLSE
jgi:hypothetical protein